MLGKYENNFRFYSLFPKIEKTTFDVTLVHFLLMFGYKLFSLFYPLFLVSIGLSVIKVGWVYLLIYGTIAIAAIMVDFYIHRANPALVASLGIVGYAIYSLIMLTSQNTSLFYFAQILLGISAAFWLVSLKSILISSEPRSYDESFGWFYSAPEYASAIAPAVGALVIWKFGFSGVFILSFLIQIFNAAYCYTKLKNTNSRLKLANITNTNFRFGDLKIKYLKSLEIIKGDKLMLSALLVVFSALLIGGVYRAFFVLFLKDLGYLENEIMKFMSILSIVFVPLSIGMIKIIGQWGSIKNISFGTSIRGFAAIILGLGASALNIFSFFILMLIDGFGGLAAGSGKSALFAQKLKSLKEEASTLDSILTQIGVALGAIIGGVIISRIGYENTFALLGGLVLIFSLINIGYYKKRPKVFNL